MIEQPYYEQVNIANTVHLRELIALLPEFTWDFFRGIEPNTSSRTQIAYAYDLKIFFDYIAKYMPQLIETDLASFPVKNLDSISGRDIEKYLEYLKYYKSSDEKHHINGQNGLKRKLSSLRTFYSYYYKNEDIDTNPTLLVTMPKLDEKEIVRLDVDEVAILLDKVESGDNLSSHQKSYHAKTKVRDLAIMTLLLGTGIRVSECVGLNLDDVDFKNTGIKIYRKGGKEVIVYFGDEVEKALSDYMDERKKIIPQTGSLDALFLSMQKKRITVRAVENLVKKYSRQITTLKHITPHKLRSTYGTNLYRETQDIYLVADVLGHNNVNTTRKHYAAMEEDRRRSAKDAVKLRED